MHQMRFDLRHEANYGVKTNDEDGVIAYKDGKLFPISQSYIEGILLKMVLESDFSTR